MRIDTHQHFWRYHLAEYGWIEEFDVIVPVTREFVEQFPRQIFWLNIRIATAVLGGTAETFWKLASFTNSRNRL